MLSIEKLYMFISSFVFFCARKLDLKWENSDDTAYKKFDCRLPIRHSKQTKVWNIVVLLVDKRFIACARN